MPAFLMTAYAAACYAFFSATFLGLVGFLGNLPWPVTIDGGAPGPVGEAVLVNLLLIALFGLQHSVMARPAFKRWWTRFVPEPIERSTYVLAATALLALLLVGWHPIPAPVIWDVGPGAAAWVLVALSWAGWALVMASTFLINHFELFGLRQAFAHLLGRSLPEQAFRTPSLYRHVRHPLYLGFLIAFWATPRMSAGHLLFAVGFTLYILVGIGFEEHDLMAHFGDRYRAYREQVGMLLPLPKAARRRSSVND